jgi:hypothetical protein
MLGNRGMKKGGRKSRLALSFRLPFLPPYINPLFSNIVTSALKMETVRFSETLASTSQFTRRPNPEEHHHYPNHVYEYKLKASIQESDNFTLVNSLQKQFLSCSLLKIHK